MLLTFPAEPFPHMTPSQPITVVQGADVITSSHRWSCSLGGDTYRYIVFTQWTSWSWIYQYFNLWHLWIVTVSELTTVFAVFFSKDKNVIVDILTILKRETLTFHLPEQDMVCSEASVSCPDTQEDVDVWCLAAPCRIPEENLRGVRYQWQGGYHTAEWPSHQASQTLLN